MFSLYNVNLKVKSMQRSGTETVILVISRFGFECRILVLITQVPGHCLLFALTFPGNNVGVFQSISYGCMEYFLMCADYSRDEKR